ncbi:MAG: lysophospholipid acyltransferase family protein [Pyrinomonadaceae bacterium]
MENIPSSHEGGLIVAANHQTYIDPFWISAPIKRPTRYLAWSEAFHWPLVGRLMTLFGAWPLQIEGGDRCAIRRTLQYLREGGAVMIFPEGGRCCADGELDRFKNGAVRIALEANAIILPVTIRGGDRVWPRGWSFPRLGRKVEIVYHPPRKVSLLAGEDLRQAVRRETDQLVGVIKSAL